MDNDTTPTLFDVYQWLINLPPAEPNEAGADGATAPDNDMGGGRDDNSQDPHN